MTVMYIREGFICDDCVRSNNLLLPDYMEGIMGTCTTCSQNSHVLHTQEYIIPANVQLVKTRDVASIAKKLETTTRLFDKQTELFYKACDEIERLERENSMLRLGSRWSGTA